MAEAAAESFVDRVVPTPEAGDGGSDDTGAAASNGEGAISEASRAGDAGQRAEAPTDAGDKSGSETEPAIDGAAGVKTVPLAALQEARAELKALKAEINELKAQPRLTVEEKGRLASLEQTRDATQQKVEEKDPDFLEDPKGYIDTKLTKAFKKLEDLESTGKQRFSQMDEKEQVATVVQHIQSQEAAFSKATPDYADALTHVRTIRTSQLKMLFPQASDAQISQQLAREEFGAAQQVAQAGGNVAEFAYNYAKTFGYQPKQGEDKSEKKPDKSAARSLGGGGGATSIEEGDEGGSEFKTALAERFGVRKRK